MQQSRYKQANFLIALALVIITIFLMTVVYSGSIVFPAQLAWIGALFIAIFTPAYHVVKKSYPSEIKKILGIHIYGNLFAVMFVALHLSQEIIQPQPYSTFLTGILLGATMILLVSTGFLLRFQSYLRKVWKYIHINVTIAFYIVLVLHIIIAHHNILQIVAM